MPGHAMHVKAHMQENAMQGKMDMQKHAM